MPIAGLLLVSLVGRSSNIGYCISLAVGCEALVKYLGSYSLHGEGWPIAFCDPSQSRDDASDLPGICVYAWLAGV